MSAFDQDGLIIGVDVGGTKVAAGLVQPDGTITKQLRVPMAADGTPQDGFASVKTAIDALCSGAATPTIHGIGICSPGPLDPKTGVVINPPNLPCWRDFPLGAETAKAYGLPVSVDNDANAAGLAEALWGAGSGYRNVFYATLGTGIGTGVIFDQQVYHGRTGAAGEGGHMSIDYRGPLCGCGKRGCIEALASGPAIARRALRKLQESRSVERRTSPPAGPKDCSSVDSKKSAFLLELFASNPKGLTAETVGRADIAGDPLAHQVLLETIVVLAIWLSNIVDLLEPDVIVLGGGAASLLQPYLDDLRGQVADTCLNSRAHEIPLLFARYGADAGIAGGASLCRQSRQCRQPDARWQDLSSNAPK